MSEKIEGLLVELLQELRSGQPAVRRGRRSSKADALKWGGWISAGNGNRSTWSSCRRYLIQKRVEIGGMDIAPDAAGRRKRFFIATLVCEGNNGQVISIHRTLPDAKRACERHHRRQ